MAICKECLDLNRQAMKGYIDSIAKCLDKNQLAKAAVLVNTLRLYPKEDSIWTCDCKKRLKHTKEGENNE